MSTKSCLSFAVCLLALTSGSVLRAQTFRSINFASNDMVYDAATNKIYATVPGSGSTSGKITAINPSTGAIGASIALGGSDPGKIVVSDDGSYLYTTLNSGNTVTQINALTGQPGVSFALGRNVGSISVGDMAVVPGHPTSLAVNMRDGAISPDFVGLGIFDNGVRRPTITAGYTSITAASPTTFYGYNGGTSQFDFDTITINANGASRSKQTNGLLSGYGLRVKYASNGFVYSSNGAEIDPIAGRVIGAYSGTGFADDVLALPARHRVYFLSFGGNFGQPPQLWTYNMDTFALLSMQTIPGLSSDAGSLQALDNNTLAFRSGSRIYFADLPVPEPTALVFLLAAGLTGTVFLRRRAAKV